MKIPTKPAKVRTPKVTQVAAVGQDAEISLTHLGTGFDYLNGAFDRAEKTRRTFVGASIAVSVLGVAVLGLGLQAHAAQSAGQTDADAVGRTDATVRAELAKIDQSQGIAAASLRDHASQRQTLYKQAIGAEVDLPNLLAQLRNALPAGARLTAITFSNPAAATGTAPATGTATSGTPATPATPAQPAATATPGADPNAQQPAQAPPMTVTITGSASSFGLIGVWANAVENIRGLDQVEPTWAGGGDALQVTLTAQVTSDAWSQRAVEANTSDEFGIPAVPAASGSPTGSQAVGTPSSSATGQTSQNGGN